MNRILILFFLLLACGCSFIYREDENIVARGISRENAQKLIQAIDQKASATDPISLVDEQ